MEDFRDNEKKTIKNDRQYFILDLSQVNITKLRVFKMVDKRPV